MTLNVIWQGLDKLINAFRRAPEKIRRAGERHLNDLGEYGADRVRHYIRDGGRVDTGDLLNSVRYTARMTPAGPEIVLFSEASYAPYVEWDTRPHFPPIAALEGWADRHGIPAYAVAQKIAREGTEGIHMFESGFEDTLKEAEKTKGKLGKDILISISWT